MYSSIKEDGNSKNVGMYQSIGGPFKSFEDDENLKNGGAPIYESIDHQSQLQTGQFSKKKNLLNHDFQDLTGFFGKLFLELLTLICLHSFKK